MATKKKKNPYAVALGRKGGAEYAKRSSDLKKAQAKKAAEARWKKERESKK